MAIRNGCCSVAMTVPQAFAALRVIAINCGRPGNTRTTKREELLARISRDKRSGPSGVAPRSASDLFASLRGHSRFSFAPSRPFAAIRGFHSPLRAQSRPFAVFTRPFAPLRVHSRFSLAPSRPFAAIRGFHTTIHPHLCFLRFLRASADDERPAPRKSRPPARHEKPASVGFAGHTAMVAGVICPCRPAA